MKSIHARTVISGVVIIGTAFGVLEACSDSSSGGGGTTQTGTDSGSGNKTDGSSQQQNTTDGSMQQQNTTDGSMQQGTDSGNSGSGDAGPGDPCTGAGGQGSCATGLECENFAGKGGDFCTKACAVAQQDPAPECEDAGAAFTGKCGGMKFCQIQ